MRLLHRWWLLPPAILLTVLRDRLLTADPVLFYVDGVQSDALSALLILAFAVASATWSSRRVLGFALAVQACAAGLWIALADIAVIWLRL